MAAVQAAFLGQVKEAGKHLRLNMGPFDWIYLAFKAISALCHTVSFFSTHRLILISFMCPEEKGHIICIVLIGFYSWANTMPNIFA